MKGIPLIGIEIIAEEIFFIHTLLTRPRREYFFLINFLFRHSYHTTIRYIFTIAIFKPRQFFFACNFTQGWLNIYYCLLSAFSSLFIVHISIMNILEVRVAKKKKRNSWDFNWSGHFIIGNGVDNWPLRSCAFAALNCRQARLIIS